MHSLSDIKASRGVIPICFKVTINLPISRIGRRRRPVRVLIHERHYLGAADFSEEMRRLDDGRRKRLQTFELGSLRMSSQHAI